MEDRQYGVCACFDCSCGSYFIAVFSLLLGAWIPLLREKKTAASGGKTAETDCGSAKAEDVLLVLNALNQDAEAPEKTSYADEPSEAPWDDQL